MVWYRWQIKILKCIKRAQEHPRLPAVIRRGASRYFRLRSTVYKGRQYSERNKKNAKHDENTLPTSI